MGAHAVRPLDVLVSNSAASAIRAGANSLALVALPFLLYLLMPGPEYAAWSVILSLSSFVMYFDLGMSTSIQAIAAENLAAGNRAAARQAGIRGMQALSLIGLLAIGGSALAAWHIKGLFPDLPRYLESTVALSLVVVTFAQSCVLVANVGAGYFAGLQRQLAPSLVFALGRLGVVVGVTAAAALSSSLSILAFAYSLPSAAIVYIIWRWVTTSAPAVPQDSDAYSFARLLRFSGPLALWAICSLPTFAMAPVVVGRLDYAALPTFALAVSVGMGVMGAAQAIFSPVLSELTRAAKRPASIGPVLERVISLGVALPFALGAVGVGLTTAVAGVLAEGSVSTMAIVLVIYAAALRHSMSPISFAAISTGRHSKVKLQPVLDAIFAVVLVIAGGQLFGATGVACALLLSSVLAVMLTTCSVMPVVGITQFVERKFVFVRVVSAVLWQGPAILAVWIAETIDIGVAASLSVIFAGVVTSFFGVLWTGLQALDRVRLWRAVSRPVVMLQQGNRG